MHAQDMEVGNDGQDGFPCPSSFCDVGAALSPNLESQGICELPKICFDSLQPCACILMFKQRPSFAILSLSEISITSTPAILE